MLAMALGMSLTALSVAPVGTMGIGNVAVSAMSGQGRGRMEMDMSGGPGMAGDGVGEPDATCATTGVGTNPPLDNPRSSTSGRCSKAEAWGNNEASAGPSSESTCRATIAHLMRGVGIGKSSAGSNRAAVATAGEDGSCKAAACDSSLGEAPPPGKLKAFFSGGGHFSSGAGRNGSCGSWTGGGRCRGDHAGSGKGGLVGTIDALMGDTGGMQGSGMCV